MVILAAFNNDSSEGGLRESAESKPAGIWVNIWAFIHRAAQPGESPSRSQRGETESRVVTALPRPFSVSFLFCCFFPKSLSLAETVAR